LQNNTFSTLFVGQNLIKLSAVDSTNNYLKNLVSKSEPLPEGTVIMAEDQFAGRGQQENTWHAEPGKNLTISVLLKPVFLPINLQFLLNMAISIAINQALSGLIGDQVRIKWPNDIYFGNKKLGGVLIENSIVGSAIKTAVVGIGINVNQQVFNPAIANTATSLNRILQRDVNLELLLNEICSHIEYLYLRLKGGDYTFLRTSYVDKLYLIGTPAYFRKKEELFKGIIKGVSDAGMLLVETEEGDQEFNFKEIEFINHT
jgi:BirA family biotin operon repressor/biotin-[acetyl-CoA-carboxylase] ligase